MAHYAQQIRIIPLFWLALALLAGIGLASVVALPLLAWVGAALVLGLLLVGSYRWPRSRLAAWRAGLALLCVLSVGAARYQWTQAPPTPEDLAYYVGGEASLVGRVIRPAVQHDTYTEYWIEGEYLVSPEGQRTAVSGRVRVLLPVDADWTYGDRLRLDGRLEALPADADFSYADYLARFGIQALIAFPDARYVGPGASNPLLASLYAVRARGLEVVYRLYPDPEASLLAGILLGDESGLSPALKGAYNDTSLRHIIAISGFNITIIAGLLLAIFSRWLGRRRGAWLAALGVAIYTILVGADAAVLRAAIMGGLALLARQVGRRQFGLNTLAFTAALMALFNPLLLWDVGFQLSFAATLGILLYADPMSAALGRWLAVRMDPERAERWGTTLSELVVITLAAQVTTLPLLLYHFQRLSLVSLPANLLVLPVQPALMVLGGLSVLAGMAWLPFGRLLSFFAWPLAAYSNRLAIWFAGLPGASQAVAPFGFGWLILVYLLLFGLTLGWGWLRPRLPRPRPALVGALMGALCLWLWSAALAAPDGRLTLTLLDVPGGEALLLRTPEGRNLLINGGSSAIALSEAVGQRLPPFQRNFDWLIVAGVRQEQVAALVNGAERLAPDQIAWAGDVQASLAAEQLHGELTSRGLDIQDLAVGEVFDLGQGARLQVLGAGSRGALLLLVWGDFRALLPLGLDFDMLAAQDDGWALGPVDLLLLADNGYLPLNPPDWIENLSPTVIWLSVGDELPSTELLDQLAGRTLLRTDTDGWLQLSTDGQEMWLEQGK